MLEILELTSPTAPLARRAAEVLENGGLVLLPTHRFELEPGEAALIDPALLDPRAKNISLDPATERLGGAVGDPAQLAAMTAMIARFADTARALAGVLAPDYGPALQRRRTSFRPGAVETRGLSPRKDDRRLHTDAFPATPVQGRRILRVFANVDPSGADRIWDVGEDSFGGVAERFADRLAGVRPAGRWRERLGLTRGPRTAYDGAMLRLHDAAKLSDAYQQDAPKRRVAFPAGSSWMVYTDATLHAALSGRHALEQTFLMEPEAMNSPAKSPLRILERQLGRPLV